MGGAAAPDTEIVTCKLAMRAENRGLTALIDYHSGHRLTFERDTEA